MTASPRGAVTRGVARAVVAVVAAAAWVLAGSSAVAAHAELAAAEPAANAAITELPAELRLEFTEPIDPSNSTVELIDELGRIVEGAGRLVPLEGAEAATLALPELDPGVYVVRYQVLSTVDGHVTGGSFAFAFDPSGSQPPPAVAPTTSSPTADPFVAIARWIALAGVLVLVGTGFFWLVAVRPALVEPRPWPVLALSGILATIGIVAFLILASRDLPGRAAAFPLDPAAAFGATQFGTAMRVALGASVVATFLAVVLTVRPPATPDGRPGTGAVVGLAGVIGMGGVALAGFSSGGHVAALGGIGFAALDWAHLAAVGAWLGALPAYLALAWALRGKPRERRRAVLGHAIRRHSRVAFVAAPIVALTGIANSPIVLGSARNLVASDYGNLLLAKVLLFGIAFGIGAANWFLVRRLRLRPLVATIGAELAVGALAVLVAAGLLTVPAAASRAPRIVTTNVPTAHLYGDVAGYSVHALISVPSPGGQRYQVVVSDADGAPVTDLQRVFMTFVPPAEAELTEARARLEPTDVPGLYETTGAYTPVVGDWGIDVTLRAAGEPDATLALEVPVVTAPAPETLPPEDTGIGTPAPVAALWRLVPPAPYEWLPALALFGVAGLLWIAGPTSHGADRRDRLLRNARVACVTLGAVAALATGSQALVRTANAAPDAPLPTENPIAATDESIAAGEAAYLATCVLCHGVDGAGDGPGASTLPVRPAPLGEHVPHHTDAQLFAFITRGISGTPMPGFATELLPEERWNLVNYLRSRWPAP